MSQLLHIICHHCRGVNRVPVARMVIGLIVDNAIRPCYRPAASIDGHNFDLLLCAVIFRSAWTFRLGAAPVRSWHLRISKPPNF